MTAEKSKTPDKVVIFMVGNSRGNADGQRRTVDQETADELVYQGLARLPESKQE